MKKSVYTAALLAVLVISRVGIGQAGDLQPLTQQKAQGLYLNADGGDKATGYVEVDNPASGFIVRDPANIEWVFQPKTDGTLRVTKLIDMPSAVGSFVTSGVFRDVRGVIPSTFTRTTTRGCYNPTTGLYATVPVGTVGVESAGALIEKQVTNHVLWGGDQSHTPWVAGTGMASLIANMGIAPDGTMTAAKLTPSATTARIYQIVVPGVTINGYTWTWSTHIQADVAHNAKIRLDTRDNSSNTLETIEFTVPATTTLTRYSVSLACTNPTATRFLVAVYPDITAGTAHVYSSFGQLTQTVAPFRYIPTTTVAVTKSLDALSLTNNGILADSAGSVMMTYTPLSASTETVTNTIIAGPGNGLLYRDGANIKSDDGTSVLTLPATWSAAQPLRITLTWDVNGRKLHIGTGSSATAAYDGSFGLVSTIDFFQGASAPNGNLKDVKFWNGKKLSDPEVTAWQ
ncbi:MAG: hypothetical protein HZA22_04700 [Nitrospirae bacterium]|nr:hypothetical protein [Nitrospirota bacterium]